MCSNLNNRYIWIGFSLIDPYLNHLTMKIIVSSTLLSSRTNTRLEHISLSVKMFDCCCLSQTHQQSKTHTGNERRANLLCSLMKYLTQLCYSYFIIQRFGAVTVSQASSTVTDGIKGLPTFNTKLTVTL